MFRKQGKALTPEEKWMVLQVLRQSLEQQNHSKTEVYQQASYYTGVSEKVVIEIARYFEQTGTIPPMVKPGNRTNHKTLVAPNAIGQKNLF